MHPLGHINVWRPPGPGTRCLTILQSQALDSAIGRGHVNQGRSDLPCPVGLTLTLGWFFRLPSPVAWPASPPLWRLLIHNAGFWVPPTWKLCHLAVCRTFLAGETSIPAKRPHLPRTSTAKSRWLTRCQTNALNAALGRA